MVCPKTHFISGTQRILLKFMILAITLLVGINDCKLSWHSGNVHRDSEYTVVVVIFADSTVQ